MWKKIGRNRIDQWYLSVDINDIRRVRSTHPERPIVCITHTLLGGTKALFYYQGERFSATCSNIEFADWNTLMRIRSDRPGREATKIENQFFHKITKQLTEATEDKSALKKDNLSKAQHDEAVALALISEDGDQDEDIRSMCVIS